MLCPHNLTHEFKLTWIKCQVPWTYWTSNIMCFVVLYEPFLFIVCIWKKFSCEHDNGLIVLHDLRSLDLDIDQHLITSGFGRRDLSFVSYSDSCQGLFDSSIPSSLTWRSVHTGIFAHRLHMYFIHQIPAVIWSFKTLRFVNHL